MAFRDSTFRANAAAATAVGDMPTTVEGDRLLAIISADSSSATITAVPSGWVAVGAALQSGSPDGHLHALYELKSATGSEGATQQWTLSAAADNAVVIMSFSGRHATAALTFATATHNTAANATPISLSGNSGTAAAGDDIAAVVSYDATTAGTETWATSAWSGGLTEREDGHGSWVNVAAATVDGVAAGAFGAVTATGTRTVGANGAGYALWAVALPAGASGGGWNLTGTGPRSTPILGGGPLGAGTIGLHVRGTSAGGGTLDLAPAPVSLAPTLGAPSIAQAHQLTTAPVSLAPTLGAPSIAQAHQLAAAPVSFTPTFALAPLGAVHQLAAAPVSFASTLDALALVQAHQLAAAPVSFASTLDAPALVQAHLLVVEGATFAPTFELPAIGGAASLSGAPTAYSLTVTAPAVTQVHALAADGVTFAPALEVPALEVEGAVIDLAADGLTFAPAFAAARLEEAAELGMIGGARAAPRVAPRVAPRAPRAIDLAAAAGWRVAPRFAEAVVRQRHALRVTGTDFALSATAGGVAQVWRKAEVERLAGPRVPRGAQLTRVAA